MRKELVSHDAVRHAIRHQHVTYSYTKMSRLCLLLSDTTTVAQDLMIMTLSLCRRARASTPAVETHEKVGGENTATLLSRQVSAQLSVALDGR